MTLQVFWRAARWAGLLACLLSSASSAPGQVNQLEPVGISSNQTTFVLKPSGVKFTPWGFNYDHDETGRLLEDYWETEWAKVEEDFREMKQLGANVVRIHLQLGKFMSSEQKPNPRALRQLARLIRLAERTRLYLDLTGLGCYHKKDVPGWYDALPEERRWAVQARFWQAVAERGRNSHAIFCYDLMNEPVSPPPTGKREDWLGPPFAGKHFVQVIALEAKGRPRPAIARAWIQQLARAIRREDSKHLITVGLVPWSLDRPGLTSGFGPGAIAPDVDFISAHIYPEDAKPGEALETLRGFAVGKPVVIEEIFPLSCSIEELGKFVEDSRKIAAGWIGFYWGKTLQECRASNELSDALTLDWLEFFQREAERMQAPDKQR